MVITFSPQSTLKVRSANTFLAENFNLKFRSKFDDNGSLKNCSVLCSHISILQNHFISIFFIPHYGQAHPKTVPRYD